MPILTIIAHIYQIVNTNRPPFTIPIQKYRYFPYKIHTFYHKHPKVCYNEAMGLFNFFKKSEQQTSAESSSASSQWDDLNSVPFQGDSEQSDTEAQRIKHRGDQILASHHYSMRMLHNNHINLTDTDRIKALDDLYSGKFSASEQSQILQSVDLPVGKPGQENYAPTLLKISDRQPSRILAFATFGPEAANAIHDASTINDEFQHRLQMLLRKYPTPLEFAPVEESMMQRLRDAGNSPAKLSQYEDTFEQFKQDVYGERYDYYKALEVLKDQALQQHLAEQSAADRPRREAELQELQTPIPPSAWQPVGNPYAAPETRTDRSSSDDNHESK